MAYLTMREYVRSGPVCLGVLLVIIGAVLALRVGGFDPLAPNTVLVGLAMTALGLIFVVCGFFFTKKKRDSVLTKIDTSRRDVPPPPPGPD